MSNQKTRGNHAGNFITLAPGNTELDSGFQPAVECLFHANGNRGTDRGTYRGPSKSPPLRPPFPPRNPSPNPPLLVPSQ